MTPTQLARACAAALTGSLVVSAPLPASAADSAPHVGHVWTIVLENSEYEQTYIADRNSAPYLTQTLPAMGKLVENYYGTGHSSLDNYIAMASGQGPNASTKGDCDTPTTLGGGSPEPAEGAWHFDSNGQAVDDSGADPIGCTYPAAVKNISDQLQDAQITWKGYMENMDADPNVTPACSNPFNRGSNVNPGYRHDAQNPDNPQYKDKHNPFAYFHSLFDQDAYCREHVVPLGYLDADGTTAHGSLIDDLQQLDTTPQFSFITPDQCHDGHDGCANSGGDKYAGVDQFLKAFVPAIMNSDAYKQDGLIVITTDEGSTNLWCCGEENQKAPNLADNDNNGAGPAEIGAPVPDPVGDGGGKVGAVLLSPLISDHSQDVTHSFNHYSYLRSMEDLFGLPHLGYAAADGLQTFQDAGLIPASSPGPELPEAPTAALLVVAALAALGATSYVRRRRSSQLRA